MGEAIGLLLQWLLSQRGRPTLRFVTEPKHGNSAQEQIRTTHEQQLSEIQSQLIALQAQLTAK